MAVFWLGCQGLTSSDSQAATPNSSKTKLIVFVHGFTGNQGTWSKFAKLVREDATLGDFEVYTMEYPTSTFWENASVRQIGELLRTELDERFSTYSEVYLIGHSMGGLVICSMVIEQLRAGRAQDLKRIKHIMLFATPNNGTQIPKLLSWYNTQLADLSSTGHTVDDMRNEWINRVYNPKISPGDENSKLQIPATVVVGLEDHIVDEASAKSFFRDPPPVTVPGDHRSMKEPNDHDSLAYVIVRNKLLSSRKPDRSSPPLAGVRDIQPQSTPSLREQIEQIAKEKREKRIANLCFYEPLRFEQKPVRSSEKASFMLYSKQVDIWLKNGAEMFKVYPDRPIQGEVKPDAPVARTTLEYAFIEYQLKPSAPQTNPLTITIFNTGPFEVLCIDQVPNRFRP